MTKAGPIDGTFAVGEARARVDLSACRYLITRASSAEGGPEGAARRDRLFEGGDPSLGP
jgi:hypothetical protein